MAGGFIKLFLELFQSGFFKKYPKVSFYRKQAEKIKE